MSASLSIPKGLLAKVTQSISDPSPRQSDSRASNIACVRAVFEFEILCGLFESWGHSHSLVSSQTLVVPEIETDFVPADST